MRVHGPSTVVAHDNPRGPAIRAAMPWNAAAVAGATPISSTRCGSGKPPSVAVAYIDLDGFKAINDRPWPGGAG